jgi:hypothetical protein
MAKIPVKDLQWCKRDLIKWPAINVQKKPNKETQTYLGSKAASQEFDLLLLRGEAKKRKREREREMEGEGER